MQGKIIQIRKADKEFEFETSIAGKKLAQKFPYSKVHAVTLNGRRFELTPLDDMSPTPPGSDAKAVQRTKSEVVKYIDRVGQSLPDWFEPTPLNYPESLDLSWPPKPEGTWNNQKNVGQFIWDVVNPNESRWYSGIKLVHHCMSLHENDKALLRRDMSTLGNMYFNLLQDYPRAAYWYQKSGASVNMDGGIRLAECYWRLGNKDMAMEMMRGKFLHVHAIKLLGDIGELENALDVTAAYGKTQLNNEAFLAAGDALRQAGRLDEAIEYYQRVLDSDTARNEDYDKRFKARAAESIEAIKLYDQANVSRVADGTYTDSTTGYNGALKVEVKVAAGRIIGLKVTDHREKQFYASLTDTPRKIIEKQNIRDIDGTSGATITSQAIVNATAKALAQGTR